MKWRWLEWRAHFSHTGVWLESGTFMWWQKNITVLSFQRDSITEMAKKGTVGVCPVRLTPRSRGNGNWIKLPGQPNCLFCCLFFSFPSLATYYSSLLLKPLSWLPCFLFKETTHSQSYQNPLFNRQPRKREYGAVVLTDACRGSNASQFSSLGVRRAIDCLFSYKPSGVHRIRFSEWWDFQSIREGRQGEALNNNNKLQFVPGNRISQG